MNTRLPLLALLLTLPSRAADPVPVGLFTLSDPSLEITVWAHSPLFLNPTNIDIDKDGCIWVAEGVNYRKNSNRKPEGDRIMVLRDNNGDGTADESWPFVQEPFLKAPLGVAVIGNKVVVSMAPDLVVYTDKDGDKKFDPAKGDTREVLLTGFFGRNHDHSLHSVTVGPDGKWYFSAGNCGAEFTDKSGKTFRIGSKQNTSWWPRDGDRPEGDPNQTAGQKSDDGKVYVGGFIARMNPDGTNVEILAHNLRNSYENCVTSFGDIFASDNDDQPACRVFGVLEGGNYGFASADGSRPWQADRRPGQSIATATWRQEDPGVAPAGDLYGGGAPTGIVFYENGALGPQHEGTLLVCESARNTIFGYKPQPDGAGWKLERFDFLTTNKEGKVIGTDYTGGAAKANASDTKTLFRPSDIAVGPDGALYIADWHDPRVGGHADMDDSLSGTIYRVAPKGFKSVVPKFDVATEDGAIEALRSPAVHVRALGAKAVRKKLGEFAGRLQKDYSKMAIDSPNGRHPLPVIDYLHARHAFLSFGSAVTFITDSFLPSFLGGVDYRSPRALSYLNGWGEPSDIYQVALKSLPNLNSVTWDDRTAAIAWWLHPHGSIPAFKTRSLSPALPLKARKDALTAIGYNTGADAAQAMLAIVEALGTTVAANSPEAALKDTAMWWLLNRKDNVWKDHGLAAALKEKGIYDPDKIVLTAMSLPEPPPAAFTAEDALKLTGDAKRGEVTSQRCYVCHQFDGKGAEYGPDLATWGRTQGTEVILRSLIDPSADIAHGFAGMRLETTDNLIIDGLILTDADPVVIRSMGGLTQTVPKSKIKTKTPLGRSLMMSATQLALTPQDAADLAAFLRR
jgi:putative membrane-bound dehydrogenase-like protein